jgi:hypothetical protein
VNAYLRIVDTLDTEIELAGRWIAAGLATDPSDRAPDVSQTGGGAGIARATKGAVSDPSPLGDPMLSKVIKVPPSTTSPGVGGLHQERPLGGAHHRPLPGTAAIW